MLDDGQFIDVGPVDRLPYPNEDLTADPDAHPTLRGVIQAKITIDYDLANSDSYRESSTGLPGDILMTQMVIAAWPTLVGMRQ